MQNVMSGDVKVLMLEQKTIKECNPMEMQSLVKTTVLELQTKSILLEALINRSSMTLQAGRSAEGLYGAPYEAIMKLVLAKNHS